jgi:hypothetical protein
MSFLFHSIFYIIKHSGIWGIGGKIVIPVNLLLLRMNFNETLFDFWWIYGRH